MIERINKSDWDNCSIPEKYIDEMYPMSMRILNSMRPTDEFFVFRDKDLLIEDILIYVYDKRSIYYKSVFEYDYNVLKLILDELDESLFHIKFMVKHLESDEKIATSPGNNISMNLKLDRRTKLHIYEFLDSLYLIYSGDSIIDEGIIHERYGIYKAVFINGYHYNVRHLYFYNDTLCLELSNYMSHSKSGFLNIRSNFVSKYIRNNKVKIFKDLLSSLGVPSDLLNNIN